MPVKRNSPIPESDTVLRHINTKHLMKDHTTGAVVGCYHEIFKLRKEKGEKDISVNWVGFFEGSRQEKLKSCIEDFGNGYSISRKSIFAELNVKDIKDVCKSNNAKIKVVYTPNSKIKSHSSVMDIPQDNACLFDDLCKLALTSLISAADI